MTDPRLAGYAGRFVWLELDFDKPENKHFLTLHNVAYTPSLFVIDPVNERALARQSGGLTVPELVVFLDGHSGASGPDAWTLMAAGDWAASAAAAAAEAPHMPRNSAFARVVLAGLMSANQGGTAAWAERARQVLEPLAAEAVTLPSILRDHRFQIYQTLMDSANARGDRATVMRWGDRWLHEIDATAPASDDERSALDIARVDAAGILGDPARVLPALIASERVMPANYNASLRVAQMEIEAKRYDDAIAACDRGLAHVTGPLGRSWLLRTKAEALMGMGDAGGARVALEKALDAARTIVTPGARDRNVKFITNALNEMKTRQRTN
ncbi:MAG TPA: hypothetical protein VLV78_20850 [Thermoanaerobaculia bacterium]|nr:hypothetical protein [Thermoanaerobaculia bacterium]